MAIRKNEKIRNLIVTSLVISLVSPNAVIASSTISNEQGITSEEVATDTVGRITKPKVTVRKSTSSTSTKIGVLEQGQLIKILDIDEEFAQIDYNGEVGYIDIDSFKKLNLPEGTVVEDSNDMTVVSENFKVISSEAKVRDGASSSSKDIGTLTEDTEVIILKQNKGWGQIEYNGKLAFINLNDLKYVSSNIQKNTGDVEVLYIDKATNLEIDEREIYSNLQLNKKYTYNAKDIQGYSIVNDSTQTIKLNHENNTCVVVFEYEKINGRTSRSSSKNLGDVTINYIEKGTGNKIAESAQYTELALQEHSYSPKDIEGYNPPSNDIKITLTKGKSSQTINFEYEKNIEDQSQVYEMTKGDMVTVKDATWLRSSASWSADKIVILQKGEKAEFISRTESWIKVNYNGKVGYLTADYVLDAPKVETEEDKNESTPVLKKYQVTTPSSSLTVRSGAGTNYGKIGSLEKGAIIEVYSITSGWAKIKFENGVGYVSSQYITEYKESTPVLNKYQVTTSSSSLTVRSGAGTNYGKIGSLEKGAIIEVYSITSGWAKIKFENEVGYVSSEYITEYTKEETSESETNKPGIGKTIYLDAGHGGTDPGAIGKTYETKEKEMTLDVTKRVANKLKNKGYTVLESRTTDVYKSLTQRSDDANSKGSDIFVSMHFNSATSTSAQGLETLYKVDGRTSNVLAKKVQDEMIDATGLRDRGLKERSNLSVLNRTTMPAILIEGGFLSNTSEENRIKNSSYRETLANAIVEGIEEYFKLI